MAKLDETPRRLDWINYAGDQRKRTFRVTSGGTGVNITGWSIASHARREITDTGDPALIADCVITDAANGYFTVSWDGTERRDLVLAEGEEGRWTGDWDLQVSNLSGELVTHVGGNFVIKLDVTRA